MCEAGALYGVLVAERNALRQQLAAAETARARLAAVARAAHAYFVGTDDASECDEWEVLLEAVKALEEGDLAAARPAEEEPCTTQ
jgi:hypothetical protein